MRHWELALQQSPVWCHLQALRLFARSLPAHCVCVCVMECAERIWNSARQLLCIPHTKRMQRSMFRKNDYKAIAGHGDGIVRKGTNCRWWEQDNDIVTTLHHSVSVDLSQYSLPPAISHSLVLFFSRSWTRVKQVSVNQSRMFWGVCKYRLENRRRNRSLMTRTMPWRDFFSPQLFSFSCTITKLGTGNLSYLTAVYFT